jgi:polyhydroxyalkanoate synthesis regulator phasin
VNKAMQRYVEAASGLTNLTTAKAEQIAKQLVKSGEAASDQVGDIVEELLDRQKKNREAMAALVKSETTRAVRAMGLATSTEVERLQKQVADLKRELSRVERERAKTGKKAASKKSSTKKAAKKSTAKKAASKKSSSKKAAKKSTKKSAAKKSSGS